MEKLRPVYVKMAKQDADALVRALDSRGIPTGKEPVRMPFLFPVSLMTQDIPGRVEVAEFSPHFAYAYTCEWRD